MADYSTKAHIGSVRTHVRPYNTKMENSPRELVRTAPPSTRQGYG